MKKLILLLSVFTLVLTSCSNDDDTATSQDQIVGTWKYFKYLENGVEQTLDPCDTDETYIYDANGGVTVMYYDLDGNNDCVLSDTFTGTWVNAGNGAYTLSANGFTETENITFEGNTHYYEYVYDNGTPNDTSDDVTERDVYVRQ